VDALLDGAFSQQQGQGRPHGGVVHTHQHAHRPVVSLQQSTNNEDDYLDSMLRKVFLKRMLTKMLEDDYMGDDDPEISDDDEDDGMGPAVLGPMRFFKPRGPGRRRDSLFVSTSGRTLGACMTFVFCSN